MDITLKLTNVTFTVYECAYEPAEMIQISIVGTAYSYRDAGPVVHVVAQAPADDISDYNEF